MKKNEVSTLDKNKYKLTFDLHTHTVNSHGRDTIEDNVIAGIGKGLTAIGISDHGPGHVLYGIDRADFLTMRKEVDRLGVMYPEIKILLGVEANIINPSGKTDVTKEEQEDLDFFLAGYHYGVFGEEKTRATFLHVENWIYDHIKSCRKTTKVYNTNMVIKALYENDINVLTHPGDKGAFYIDEIAKTCADVGTAMEISTWHKHMSVEEIKIASKYDVQFIISSDAHVSERVGDCLSGVERALEAGLELSRIINLEVRK